MKELVLDIAKALVDNPDAVVVEETKKNDEIILKLIEHLFIQVLKS